MKNLVNLGTVALCMVFLMAQVNAGAKAFGESTPMKGSGAGQITEINPGSGGVVITAVGEGTATKLGKFTRSETILLDPATGTVTGTITFVAADGDELYCTFEGAYTSPTTLSGTYTFTGGTGRFESASGEADFNIVLADQGAFTFDFVGVIELE